GKSVLNRHDHQGFHVVRCGAGPTDVDAYEGDTDRRQAVYLQPGVRHGAHQDDREDRHDDGERPVQGQAGQSHTSTYTLSWVRRLRRVSTFTPRAFQARMPDEV